LFALARREIEHPGRVLVVEDSFYTALETEIVVREAGFEVEGPVSSAEKAIELLENTPVDGVVLDLDSDKNSVLALVDWLEARRIPFVVLRSTATAEGRRYQAVDKPVDPILFMDKMKAAFHPL